MLGALLGAARVDLVKQLPDRGTARQTVFGVGRVHNHSLIAAANLLRAR